MKQPIIRTIYDNLDNEVKIITNLDIGDKVICVKPKKGLCDGGNLYMTWRGDHLIEGKVYEVNSKSNWDGVNCPRIIDEDGCSMWVTPEYFKIISYNYHENNL